MRPLLLAAALSALAFASQAAEPKINTLHWLGSHNSYRPELDSTALAHQRQVMGERSRGVEYGHPPIAAQLDLGVRQLEFDPYADPAGGLYGAPYANDPAKAALMKQPGAKVLHAPSSTPAPYACAYRTVSRRSRLGRRSTPTTSRSSSSSTPRKSRSTPRPFPTRRCGPRPISPAWTLTPCWLSAAIGSSSPTTCAATAPPCARA